MITLQALCLDLDGTLADTLGVCVQSFQDVIEDATGRRPPRDEVVRQFGATEEGILARLLGGADPTVEEVWHRRYAELLALHVAGPFDGVPDVLERVVAAGVPIALVTGKGQRSARHTLEVLGLARFFERVDTGGDDGSVKADRLRGIVEDWRVEPTRTAYVGDSPTDVRDSRTAGVLAVAAGWAPTSDLDALRREAPDALLNTVGAFVDWVTSRLP